MSNYNKGSRAEYELGKYLWEDGWWVIRQAASGGVSHEACDVAAIKDGRVLIFEVKTGKLPIDVDDQLEEAYERCGFNGGEGGCYYIYKDGPQFYYAELDVNRLKRSNLTKFIRLIR